MHCFETVRLLTETQSKRRTAEKAEADAEEETAAETGTEDPVPITDLMTLERLAIDQVEDALMRVCSGTLKSASREGAFFLDPDSLRGHSKYTMKALSLHEGNPGHHYQLTYSIDKKVPKYMLFIDHSTCYIEGWGLYSENFTPKDDLYDWFGKLEYEMLRACRLVVDTGIHYYNWSFDKTYNYILKNTNMNEHEVRNETLRYIASPGQALAYKMGEIFFKNLRKKNEKMNIKEFHKRVLENGPLPCNLIEQKFNE